MWPSIEAARRRMAATARKFVKAIRADPEPAPPITLTQALRDAKRADEIRNAAYEVQLATEAKIIRLADALEDRLSSEDIIRQRYVERVHDLVEARQMAGSGPWLVAESRGKLDDPKVGGVNLREANPILQQGAYGDIELALQNVNWRREINLSWLEFSRWGIQQIILISRLYYIKNPIIRRLIDIAAQYVFARGVDVSSPDPDANHVLQDFLERNKSTLGQIALTNHERSKYTDGNLFFAFFADTENTGEVNVRTIDATEIMDIVCNPDDSDEPWYYRRTWTQRSFDPIHGIVSTNSVDVWYPALGFDPKEKPEMIGQTKVDWNTPIYHRKCGAVAKWHFGCPLIYPALDWAREGRRFLEACAAVMQALSQIALTIKTKGGQQALSGIKQQNETTVGPNTSLWDQNPSAVPGATFASGPGTTLEAFRSTGAGQDPERVRQYKLMACMCVGVPETFLSDVSCYSDDTEVLTDQGFVLHQQWHPGMKVACLNPASNLIEYHHPNELRAFDYSGDMIHFETQQVDTMVTPNHRMWAEPIVGWTCQTASPDDLKRGEKIARGFRIALAEEIEASNRAKGWKFSTRVIQAETSQQTIETPLGTKDIEQWARFLGYWIAEGCATQSVCKSGEIRKDGTPIMRTFRRVMIAQKPGGVLDRMRSSLQDLDLRFHEVVATAAVVNLVIVRKLLWEHLRAECGAGAKQKRLPRWIFSAPLRARKAMYEALMEGDGGRSGGSWCYGTASPQLADDMQILAHSIGLAASVSMRNRLWKGEPHPIWYVYIRTRATDCRLVKPKHISRRKYAGKVYCFSVPYGIYVTRRNGKIAVQGNTGNLATASSLDRPTELVFLERQEAWREDLVTIGKYVLSVSAKASNGKLREALDRRKIPNPGMIQFREVARVLMRNGRWMYVDEIDKRPLKKAKLKPGTIEVKCTFPSIREGDITQLVSAVVQAGTLGNSSGTVVGIDEKEMVKLLYEYLGVENGAELVEQMYPESEYDPERSQEPPEPVPAVPAAAPAVPAAPAAPAATPGQVKPSSKNLKEATDRLLSVLRQMPSAIEDSAVAEDGAPYVGTSIRAGGD